MKSLAELQEERRHYEMSLESITIRKSTRPNYDYGRGEVYGDSQEYKEYTDPSLANYYRNKIQELTHIINNYSAYVMREQSAKDFNEKMSKESEERYFQEEAVKLYEQAQDEYQSKGLIGKTIDIFKGRKPKTNLSDDEVQNIYNKEARIIDIDRKIEMLEQEKVEVINEINSNPEKYNYPEQLIAYYDDSYNKRIEQLQEEKENLSLQRGK